MKILFAPSEGKRMGGECPPITVRHLFLPEFYSKRLDVMNAYDRLIRKGNDKQLSELFGIKDPKEFERYKVSLDTQATMRAIERYNGVAYEHLKYAELSIESQSYLHDHVILFSNLFGPIRAGDCIPDYKLKQGASIDGFAPDKYYKEHFSDALDKIIGEDEVLDIRAGYYDKFYVPSTPITTLKFLKEGKVVSHWAKAYRGVVLREAARHQIKTIDALLALKIEGLAIEEIRVGKKKKEVVFKIL
ncbi:MAG: YaaA family protein [Sulfuricurvum sp.]|nr:YaaA family protein [Sulfuricurvum sp.]